MAGPNLFWQIGGGWANFIGFAHQRGQWWIDEGINASNKWKNWGRKDGGHWSGWWKQRGNQWNGSAKLGAWMSTRTTPNTEHNECGQIPTGADEEFRQIWGKHLVRYWFICFPFLISGIFDPNPGLKPIELDWRQGIYGEFATKSWQQLCKLRGQK